MLLVFFVCIFQKKKIFLKKKKKENFLNFLNSPEYFETGCLIVTNITNICRHNAYKLMPKPLAYYKNGIFLEMMNFEELKSKNTQLVSFLKTFSLLRSL